jgi:hypothetical protein
MIWLLDRRWTTQAVPGPSSSAAGKTIRALGLAEAIEESSEHGGLPVDQDVTPRTRLETRPLTRIG